jgi:predicted metalloprotease with PDZ domain
VTFNPATAAIRSVMVEMSFDAAGSEPVLLSLPAWTPGSYGISYFARWVQDFEATQDGSVIRWAKADHDTWRVHPRGSGRVRIRFRYLADQLDNSMSWSRSDFLMFNGTNLFFYPEGQPFDWPATVTIHTQPDWLIGTAMPKAATPDGRTYTETNYHDLVDHPFFIGRLEIDSAMVAGRWMRLVTYPVGSVTGARRRWVWDGLQAMTAPLAGVFGDVPWPAYNLMQIADTSYGGAAGLEHKDSHVDVVAWHALDHPVLLSLYAHEIAHAWIVKRLRPADLVPYVYHTEQPTPLLWIGEGVTDYYADIALVRGGVTDSTEFLATTERKIRDVEGRPVVSMEDGSLSTWIKPVDGSHYSYYDHGSLAGLLLDVLIRDATNNARSLDTVMRALYDSTYRQGRGFTDDEWWRTVERIGGRSFAEFRARYVNGRERLPYVAVLPLAGIRVQADTMRHMLIGVATGLDTIGFRVLDVLPGSAAADAGVEVGDYMLAVGEVSVTTEDFGAAFRQRYARSAPGTPIVIRVRRAGTELELPGELRTEEEISYRLGFEPRPSEKARRIRADLLRRVRP